MERNYETIESTNLKEDEQLDIYNLHVENQLHSALVDKWGTRLIKAKDEKRRLNRQLDLKYSEIELKIRQDPESYGWNESGKKPTEAFIKSAVTSHKAYDKLYDEYLGAEHNVDVFIIATNTINDKRESIEGEIKLFLAGYYSDLKIPKEYKQEEREEQSNNQKRRIKELKK